MDFNTGINQMIESIKLYEKRQISLYRVKENLFGIYELIDGRSDEKFADRFHQYWDFIEEVCAVNGEAEYQEKIDTQIFPAFKSFLSERHGD